jgi:hypothetical protein
LFEHRLHRGQETLREPVGVDVGVISVRDSGMDGCHGTQTGLGRYPVAHMPAAVLAVDGTHQRDGKLMMEAAAVEDLREARGLRPYREMHMAEALFQGLKELQEGHDGILDRDGTRAGPGHYQWRLLSATGAILSRRETHRKTGARPRTILALAAPLRTMGAFYQADFDGKDAL